MLDGEAVIDWPYTSSRSFETSMPIMPPLPKSDRVVGATADGLATEIREEAACFSRNFHPL